MFCRSCQKMLRDIDDGIDEGQYCERFEDLLAASDASCYICSVVVESQLRWTSATGPAHDFRLRWEYIREQSVGVLGHGFVLQADDFSNLYSFNLELEKPVIESLPPNEGGLPPPPTSTSNVQVHLLAKRWLANCLQRHSECSRECDADFRPPRLLNVKENPPKLVLGSSLQSAVSYATLSHCWGPNPTFKTLNDDNYQALQVSLPMDELPATFYQSIMFCRNIGIDYLWIDSLCILQAGENSEKDWLHHVSVMPNLYANGTINIAAEWAKSSEHGMFIDRNPTKASWPLHTFHQPRLQGTRRIVSYSDEEDRGLNSSASLRSRGWVAQERLLSPRIVRFGSDQVRWECSQSHNESEQFPNGTNLASDAIRFPIKIEPKHRRINKMLRVVGIDRPPKYNVDPWDSYRSLIMEYSEKSFTRPDSDKLAAFGAIAKRYSGILKGRYVAGFYDYYLPYALVWVVIKPQEHLPISQTYRAPSWSWAKSDMLVVMPGPGGEERIISPTIKHLNVKLSDINNPYGQLQSAELAMSAYLIPCTWEYNKIVSITFMRFSIADHDYTLEGKRISFDYQSDILGEQCDVFLCPIKFDWPSTFDFHEFQFLILRRVELDYGEAYERIGASFIYRNLSFPMLSRELDTLEEKIIKLI